MYHWFSQTYIDSHSAIERLVAIRLCHAILENQNSDQELELNYNESLKKLIHSKKDAIKGWKESLLEEPLSTFKEFYNELVRKEENDENDENDDNLF